MKNLLISRAIWVLLGLVAAFLVYRFLKSEVSGGLKAAGAAVNPLNNDNFFATSTNKLVDTLDNGGRDGSNTLGTWLADIFPSSAEREVNASLKPSGIRQGEGELSTVFTPYRKIDPTVTTK